MFFTKGLKMLLTMINTQKVPSPIERLQSSSSKRERKKTEKTLDSVFEGLGNETDANDKQVEYQGASIFHDAGVNFIGDHYREDELPMEKLKHKKLK